jgi:hypothetical protein
MSRIPNTAFESYLSLWLVSRIPSLPDRFGRKILLTVSAIFMCLSLAAMGIYFQLDELVDKGIIEQ